MDVGAPPAAASAPKSRTAGRGAAPARPAPSGDRITRLGAVDALRGVAALAVCWFHLTGSAGPTAAAVRSSGHYGWLGVEVFFVISGFVIPIALWRSCYAVTDFWRFFAKRVVRVDPPYLIAIGVAVGVGWLAARVPGIHAEFTPPSATRLLLHLGYAVPFVAGATWLTPVYWTLAIEFQYYVIVGLAYPLFAHRREGVALAAVGGLLAASVLLPNKNFFPAFAALFVIGIYGFRYRVGLTRRGVLLAVVSVSLAFCGATRGLPEAIAGGVAIATILVWRGPIPRPVLWLGGVSYSLYLLHWPVGITAVAAAHRLLHLDRASVAGSLVARLIGAAASVGAAWAFSRLVEWPSQRAAGRIRYRVRDDAHRGRTTPDPKPHMA